jgi:hypothetical protein
MKRNARRQLIVLVLVFILGSMLTLCVYYMFIVIQVRTIPMDVTIADRIGFNTNTDALHFGTVYAGGESQRTIAVTNNNSFPVTVSIINEGSLSDFVDVNVARFVVDPTTNTSVVYTCAPPMAAEAGSYNGTSKIVVTRKLL